MYVRPFLFLRCFRSDLEVWGIIGIGSAKAFRFGTKTVYMHTCMHSSIHAHYFLGWICSFIGQVGSDQRDQDIYGIRRTCPSILLCLFMCMQPCMYAHYFLACIYLPNLVQSERLRHIWNQGII